MKIHSSRLNNCTQCGLGTLRPRMVTFAHWFEGQFINIPNFPARVCDICGAREYDAAALDQLETILGPDADFRREATRNTARKRSETRRTTWRSNGRRAA